eukprot:5067285-Lingulodinium_polyedra.AAC.1
MGPGWAGAWGGGSAMDAGGVAVEVKAAWPSWRAATSLSRRAGSPPGASCSACATSVRTEPER